MSLVLHKFISLIRLGTATHDTTGAIKMNHLYSRLHVKLSVIIEALLDYKQYARYRQNDGSCGLYWRKYVQMVNVCVHKHFHECFRCIQLS